jgi:hypothetical protein
MISTTAVMTVNIYIRDGFVVNIGMGHMVMAFEPLCMKLCYLCLKSRLFYTSIIDAHAPTEDQEEEEKEEFYENLETAYANLPANEFLKKCWELLRDKSEINGMLVTVQKPQK